ncbi:T-cell antigen CD7 isoform X2 [Struthio camelus]|uniref:T-cell antigen CD7 isoform X2 n=1 Tax=Struthio camelus TaxID=8801 RepID=UPI0036041E84
MDSLPFAHLCFLLLTVSSPFLNTATSSGDSAEGTKGSSFSSTKVTAYDCKHCGVSVCELSNFSCCTIIGETQDETFSNEVIQLVTNETHITMCFQQANTFSEQIYAIIWAKAGGIGDSCGILKAEASPENRGETVVSEQKKTCCTAQVQLAVPSTPLNCYADKDKSPQLGSPEDGNDVGYMSSSVSKQGTIGISTTFVSLVACLVGLAYCVLKNRTREGEENEFLEHSPDFIGAWEGDSVSIICSMKKSENEEGTYLRTRYNNVVYLSRQNTSYILPALADRVNYSNEGKNLRITLHNVQQNDSNIYLCTTFIKNSHYVKLDGKRTVLVVRGKNNGIVEQSPHSLSVQQDQSISITCSLKSSHEEEGVFLLRTHMKAERVLYVSRQNISTIFPAFANRLEYSKQEKTLVITLHNLQKSDSDIYVCVAVFKNSSLLSLNASGTMVLVKEVEQTECSSNPWNFYGLITAVVLLLSALTCCIFYNVNIKKYFQKRKTNAVYEDMSYSSRRNTLVRTNTYCNNN